MRKVNLSLLTLAVIYLLAAPLVLGQGENTAKAESRNVKEQITGPPSLQAPWNDCVPVEVKDGHMVTWDLIYPASKAWYVGGTVKDMHMSAGLHPLGFPLRWLLLQDRQFSRKGKIALTPECLLFVFRKEEKDALKDSFNLNTNFHILNCSNKLKLSEERENRDRACTLATDEKHTKSYVLAIPYAKVNLLSRAKYATSDLNSVSAAYVGTAATILTGVSDSVDVEVLGGVAGFLTVYYYFAVARPRMGDNYIGVFVEPDVSRITLSRKSNRVTATTALPHYFRVGQQIELSGVPSSDLVDISKISRDANGIVTVTTKNGHNLTVGTQVQIAEVTDPSFNGQFQVASVPADNKITFTYEQKDKPKAATSAGGRVRDVWNGTFIVDSVDSRSFTYWQLGPDENSTLQTGTAAVVVPVNTNLTVSGNLALDKTAATSPKSIDLTGSAAIAPPPGKSDEVFRKGDLLMFRIPNHHDYYNISMTLSAGTGLTFVSETAEKTSK